MSKLKKPLEEELVQNPKYLIDHIEFENNAWRKLYHLERIDFAPRITVISGLNGIGKSTILGLCANCMGITGRNDVPGKDAVSYFGTKFQADFHKLFSLTEADLEQKGRALISVKNTDDQTIIVKGCNPGKRPEGLRVVSRTMIYNKEKQCWQNASEAEDASAKIPFPVLYLGMSRAWPIGESDQDKVSVQENMVINEQDCLYINDLVKKIMPAKCTGTNAINELSISGLSAKVQRILQPNFTFPTKAISLGQGSLGMIVTALASFNKLKTELGKNYQGGLLVIDELDSGLYPAAQVDLVKVLSKEARRLRLQVIATSHSPTLLNAVHKLSVDLDTPVDSIVFLMDSRHPRVADLSFDEILQELLLIDETKKKNPTVYIYTEDNEALEMFKVIKTSCNSLFKEINHKINIKPCSLNLGNHQLQQLATNKKLPHFNKQSICVLDGDVKLGPRAKPLKLPTINDALNPPETELLNYVKAIIDGEFPETLDQLQNQKISTDRLQRDIVGTLPHDQGRENMKFWYNNINRELKTLILKMWAHDNHKNSEKFCRNLLNKIEIISSLES